jgi:4'-phosphopantetheinyl transferase EntD
MVCCLDTLDALDAPLHDEEAQDTGRMAPIRLREYVAGRTAARRALSHLTGNTAPVPRAQDRAPLWPKGVCGSLSHSRRYAVCVAATLHDFGALGVDIEEDARMEEALWDHVMTRAERSFLKALPAHRVDSVATLLFSAKEACFKGLPGDVQTLLPSPDHLAISVDFNTSTFTCTIAQGKTPATLNGFFAPLDGHWITLCSTPGLRASAPEARLLRPPREPDSG